MRKRVGWLAGLVACALGAAQEPLRAHPEMGARHLHTNRLNGDWGQVTMSWRF